LLGSALRWRKPEGGGRSRCVGGTFGVAAFCSAGFDGAAAVFCVGSRSAAGDAGAFGGAARGTRGGNKISRGPKRARAERWHTRDLRKDVQTPALSAPSSQKPTKAPRTGQARAPEGPELAEVERRKQTIPERLTVEGTLKRSSNGVPSHGMAWPRAGTAAERRNDRGDVGWDRR
jgi:hypothetical protein